LPALGAPLEGGTFAGLITLPNGTHNAVVLLPALGDGLDWWEACEWANKHGGVQNAARCLVRTKRYPKTACIGYLKANTQLPSKRVN
jgi:hypothetical protein